MSFKKNLVAFFTIGLLGVLGHFVYKWTGENRFIGLFFPVNESIWEHLKLIFYPALIYFGAEYLLKSQKEENFIPATIKAIYCGMLTVVTLFYVLGGVIGENLEFLNILIYFIAIITVLIKRNKIINNGKTYSKTTTLILLFFTALTVILFAVWSYIPPSLGIFQPPV